MISDCSQFWWSSKLILNFTGLGISMVTDSLRKRRGLLGGLIVSLGLVALRRSRLIGGIDLIFLLSLLIFVYTCWLKLVGGGENEGVLIGEGEEDERKTISLCFFGSEIWVILVVDVWSNSQSQKLYKLFLLLLFDFQFI